MAEPASREATDEDLLRVPPRALPGHRADPPQRQAAACADQGVGHCWRVDSCSGRSRQEGGCCSPHCKDDEPVRLPPFDAVEFAQDALWACASRRGRPPVALPP